MLEKWQEEGSALHFLCRIVKSATGQRTNYQKECRVGPLRIISEKVKREILFLQHPPPDVPRVPHNLQFMLCHFSALDV